MKYDTRWEGETHTNTHSPHANLILEGVYKKGKEKMGGGGQQKTDKKRHRRRQGDGEAASLSEMTTL